MGSAASRGPWLDWSPDLEDAWARAGPSSPNHGAQGKEASKPEDFDEIDTALCLTPFNNTSVALDFSERLRERLTAFGTTPEPFASTLQRRVEVLKAFVESEKERKRNSNEQEILLEEKSVTPQARELPHDVLFALHMLFRMFKIAKKGPLEPKQALLFLDQVSPFLSTLQPHCLAVRVSDNSFSLSKTERVLDEARAFIAQSFEQRHAGLDIDDKRRHLRLAVRALMGIAAARVRVSDFLLLVKILLEVKDVGVSNLPSCTATPTSTPITTPTLAASSHTLKQKLVAQKLLRRKVGPIPDKAKKIAMHAARRSKLVVAGAGAEEDPADLEAEEGLTVEIDADPAEASPEFAGVRKKLMANVHSATSATTTFQTTTPTRAVTSGSNWDLEDSELRPFLSFLGALEAPSGGAERCGKGSYGRTELWSCGQNSYGELGLADTANRKTLCRVPLEVDAVDVAAGNEHSVVLSADGTVYTVGYNDNGQCGTGSRTRIGTFTKVHGLQDAAVAVRRVYAFNGCEHSFAVTQTGALYSWGYNYRGQLGIGSTASTPYPERVLGFGGGARSVKSVACSYYHTVVTTNSGELFSFGRNDFGQLGLGDTLDRAKPTPLKALDSKPTSVACGQYHTVVITQSGALHSCGKNDYGQLGFDSPGPQRDLAQVRMNERCISAAAGYYHTLVLLRESAKAPSTVVGFGRNDYGQLGLGNDRQRIYTPQTIFFGTDVRVEQIAAGCYHSVFVTNSIKDRSKQARVFVCGRNNHGQLGLGDTKERPVPTPLPDDDSSLLDGKDIVGVAAGFYHTMLLLRAKHLGVVKKLAEVKPTSLALQKLSNHEGFTPRALALSIVAHLDRIGMRTFPSLKDVPVLRSRSPHRTSFADGGNKMAPQVHLESRPETFELCGDVLKLATECLRRRDGLDLGAVLLAGTLRVAAANVCHLLRHDIAADVQAALAEISVEKQLNNEEKKTTLVQRFRAAIWRLKETLFEVVKTTHSLAAFAPQQSLRMAETLAHIKIEACTCIAMGFEFFFATERDRTELLQRLLSSDAFDANLMPKDEDFIHAAKEALLAPLLERLISEELVSKMITNTHTEDETTAFKHMLKLLMNFVDNEEFNGAEVAAAILKTLFLQGALERDTEMERQPYELPRGAAAILKGGDNGASLLGELIEPPKSFEDYEDRPKKPPIFGLCMSFATLLLQRCIEVLQKHMQTDGNGKEADAKVLDSISISKLLPLLLNLLLPLADADDVSTALFGDMSKLLALLTQLLHRHPTSLSETAAVVGILREKNLNGNVHLKSDVLRKNSDDDEISSELVGVDHDVDESEVEDDETVPITVVEMTPSLRRSHKSNSADESRKSLSSFDAMVPLCRTLANLCGQMICVSLRRPVHTAFNESSMEGTQVELKGFNPKLLTTLHDAKVFKHLSAGVETELSYRYMDVGFVSTRLIALCGARSVDAAPEVIGVKFIKALGDDMSRRDWRHKMLMRQLSVASRDGGANILASVQLACLCAVATHSGVAPALALKALSVNFITKTDAKSELQFAPPIKRCYENVMRLLRKLQGVRAKLVGRGIEAKDFWREALKIFKLFAILQPISGSYTPLSHVPHFSGPPASRTGSGRLYRLVCAVRAMVRWRNLRRRSLKRTYAEEMLSSMFEQLGTHFASQSKIPAPATLLARALLGCYAASDGRVRALKGFSQLLSKEAALDACCAVDLMTVVSPSFSSIGVSDLALVDDATRVTVESGVADVLSAAVDRLRKTQKLLNLVPRLEGSRSGDVLYVNCDYINRLLSLLTLKSGGRLCFSAEIHLAKLFFPEVLRALQLGLWRLLEMGAQNWGVMTSTPPTLSLKCVVTTKERRKVVKTTMLHLWTLLRIIVARFAAADVEDASKTAERMLDILFGEMRDVCDKMKDRKTPRRSDASLTPDELGLSLNLDSQKGGNGYGPRRCQELISAKSPQRFLSAKDGVKFTLKSDSSSNHSGSSSKVSEDFSLLVWLYITQDSTGTRRLILAKTDSDSELWPALFLRPDDCRVEVLFGVLSHKGASISLVSDESLQLGVWTHVAVVCEGGKLSLFINGKADVERAVTGAVTLQKNKYNVFVGRSSLCKSASGFEGSVAQLRVYSRALSPIHVRIVYDQGLPDVHKVKDRKAFQLASLVKLLSTTRTFKKLLQTPEWLEVILALMMRGTRRVYQACARALEPLLEDAQDTAIKKLSSVTTWSEISTGEAPDDARASLVDFLLFVSGLGLSFDASVAKRIQTEGLLARQPLKEDIEAPLLLEALPEALVGAYVQGEANQYVAHDVTSALCHVATSVKMQDAHVFALEALRLLRRLTLKKRSNKWGSIVQRSIFGAVKSSPLLISDTSASTAEVNNDKMMLQRPRCIAAYALLGAEQGVLRAGVPIYSTANEISGVILNVDYVHRCADVVLEPRGATLNLRLEHLLPLPPQAPQFPQIPQSETFQTLTTLLSAYETGEKAPFSNVPAKQDMCRFAHMLYMQTLKRDLLCGPVLLADPNVASSLKSILERMLRKAVAFDGAKTHVTLDESIAKLGILRSRLFQVLSAKSTEAPSLPGKHLKVRSDDAPLDEQSKSERAEIPEVKENEDEADEAIFTSMANIESFLRSHYESSSPNLRVEIQSENDVEEEEDSSLARTHREHLSDDDDDVDDEDDDDDYMDANLQSSNAGGVWRANVSILTSEEEEDLESAGDIPSELVEQLMVMGFPQEWCETALRENHFNLVNASAWIVDHLDILAGVGFSEENSALESFEAQEAQEIKEDGGDGRRDLKDFQSLNELKTNMYAAEMGEEGDPVLAHPFSVSALSEDDCFDEEGASQRFAEDYFAAASQPEYNVLNNKYTGTDPMEKDEVEVDFSSLNRAAFFGAKAFDLDADTLEVPGVPSLKATLQAEEAQPTQSFGVVYNADLELASSCDTPPLEVLKRIGALDLKDLLEETAATERTVAVLFLRAAALEFLSALFDLSRQDQVVDKVLKSIPVPLLLGFTRVACCRAPQTPTLLERSTKFESPKQLFEGIFGRLLSNENKDFKQLKPSEMIKTIIQTEVDDQTTIPSALKGGHFPVTAAFLSAVLEDMTAAAIVARFRDVPWGRRMLRLTDAQAMFLPNVELSQFLWTLLETFATKLKRVLFTETVAKSLSKVLLSANMPLKMAAMSFLSSLFKYWAQELKSSATIHGENASIFCSSVKQLYSSLTSCVSPERLRCAAIRRMDTERRQNRAFHSEYLGAVVTLLNSFTFVESAFKDFEAETRFENASVTPPEAVYVGETSLFLSWRKTANTDDWSKYHLQLRQVDEFEDQSGTTWFTVYKGTATQYQIEGLRPQSRYVTRVKISEPMSSPWSTSGVMSTSGGVAFTWDRSSAGPEISVSRDALSATHNANEQWATILASEGFVSGVNSWEIVLETTATSYLFIGVATRHADVASFLGGDDHGWGYIGDRALYHNRGKLKSYGDRFLEGDVIGVTLDCNRGTLSYSRNGVDLGVAFENLSKGPLYPAVAFYNKHQRVALAKDGFSCPGGGRVVAGSPRSAALDDVLSAQKILTSMVSQTALPASAILRGFKYYQLMTRGSKTGLLRVLTTAGFQLDVDTTTEAIQKFLGDTEAKLQFGHVVRTPRGSAVVQGVNLGLGLSNDDEDGDGDLLWISPINPKGDVPNPSWCFTKAAVLQAMKRGQFMPISHHGRKKAPPEPKEDEKEEEEIIIYTEKPTPSPSTSSKHAQESEIAVADSKSSNGCRELETLVEGLDDSFALDMHSFARHCANERWTLDMDALLIQTANDITFAENRGKLGAFNFSVEEVLRLAQKLQQKLGRVSDRPVSRVDVLSRWCLLRWLNHALPSILPFCDLSSQLHRKLDNTSRGKTGGPASLNDLVFRVKRSVFTPCKLGLLDAVLDRTVTTAKKAADDYDYPENLPQILLNRPRSSLVQSPLQDAALTRFGPGCVSKGDPGMSETSDGDAKPRGVDGREDGLNCGVAPLLAWTKLGAPTEDKTAASLPLEEHTKLALSLFGQLKDQLGVLPPSQQRMSYTHPMDDGQKRSFKVKFEGEGVDDYGGPYREVLTQVGAELQSTTSEATTVEQREKFRALPALPIRCALPLLVPTANALNYDVSDDHDGSPTSNLVGPFLPNPGATSPGLLEHFRFLGKLLGIALRSRSALQLNLPLLVWKRLVGSEVEFEDLLEIDATLVQSLHHLRSLVEESTPPHSETLKEICESLKWTVTLAHGVEVAIREDQTLSPEDLGEYVDAVVQTRLGECDVVIEAIKDGLCSIVPAASLALLSGAELRDLLCGRKSVDIDLLERNTEYDEEVSPDDAHVQSFWRVLRRFSDEERAQFLRFVWARAQLPPDDKSFTQKFKMQPAVGEDAKRNADKHLPKAHTCFFSLNLPRYSSDQIMEDRLRYAMCNCVEMDADFRLTDVEMTGWDLV